MVCVELVKRFTADGGVAWPMLTAGLLTLLAAIPFYSLATTDKEYAGGLSAEMVSKSLFDLDIPWVAANRERIQAEWTSLFGLPKDLIDTSK